MLLSLSGRAWKVGDNFACGQLVPTRFDFRKTADWESAGQHLFEDSGLPFKDEIKAGDILIGGASFGRGHAHYHLQAIKACQERGIAGLFASSFNAIFQRTAINEGLPAWAYGQALASHVDDGDTLDLDLTTGVAANRTTGTGFQLAPVAPVVREILESGGLEASTLRRLSRAGVH